MASPRNKHRKPAAKNDREQQKSLAIRSISQAAVIADQILPLETHAEALQAELTAHPAGQADLRYELSPPQEIPQAPQPVDAMVAIAPLDGGDNVLQSLTSAVDALEKEKLNLTASLNVRFSEIAKLTKMYVSVKSQSEQAEMRAEQLNAATKNSSKQLEQQTVLLRTKVEENRELVAECSRLAQMCKDFEAARDVAVRDGEKLNARVEEGERVIEALRVALLSSKKNDAGTDAAVPVGNSLFRKLARLFGGRQHGNSEVILSKRIKLIESSGLFDATWYVATYPDVQDANVDPAEHYLRWGAAEGRNPGPLFNASHYVMANPDVAEQGLNPLIHYINHGMEEGRLITHKIGTSTHE